jgi:hypothetical protein
LWIRSGYRSILYWQKKERPDCLGLEEGLRRSNQPELCPLRIHPVSIPCSRVSVFSNNACRKLSYNEYHFFASGRQNCLFALFKIELKKRHSILSTFLLDLFSASEDLVYIDIPIQVAAHQLPDGSSSSSIPVEFLLCKKREQKSIFSSFPYLKNFLSPTNTKNFKPDPKDSNSLVVLCESEEAANHIIDQNIGDVLNKIGQGVNMIHISD